MRWPTVIMVAFALAAAGAVVAPGFTVRTSPSYSSQNQVTCRDGNVCGPATTCCKAAKTGVFACCPYPNAICCEKNNVRVSPLPSPH